MWTREDLAALTAGCRVHLLDRNAANLPVPDWMLGPDATTGAETTGQRIARTHPEDRQTVVDLWWRAITRPGEPAEAECRMQVGDAWHRVRIVKLSLLDDPEVGAILEVLDAGPEVHDVDVGEVIQAGEFEETRWLIHTLDHTGVIQATEGMVRAITGRDPEEVVGQSVLEHLHPDGYDDALTAWLEVQGGPSGAMRTSRQRVVRPDGTSIWTESTTIKRVADDGTVTATVLVHDVTERRRRESALQASQREFQLLAEHVPAGVFRADADQRITFRNARWRSELDDPVPVERLVDLVHPDDRARHAAELERLTAGRSDHEASYEVRGADGSSVYAFSCRSVLDLVNGAHSYVGSVTDVTDTYRLRERAERDELTGVANRAAIMEHLERALAEDPTGTLVAFVDLDGFKRVNDTWGHAAGDAVLHQLAGRLGEAFRPDDAVGRFGGDEFVVVARAVPASVAAEQRLAEAVERALAAPICFPGGTWVPAASVGFARCRPGDDASAVLRRADLAMFSDKRGRKLVLPRSRPGREGPVGVVGEGTDAPTGGLRPSRASSHNS